VIDRILQAWGDITCSRLENHGGNCCRTVRAWLHGVDRALRSDSSQMPSWVSDRYDWGPNRWPLYWCDIPKLEHLDCGAMAGLCWDFMHTRGLPVLSCQLLAEYTEESVEHWQHSWESAGLSATWAAGRHCYHEVCALLTGTAVRLWDSTDNTWLPARCPSTSPTYGQIAAVRITAEPSLCKNGDILQWGDISLTVGEWTMLPRLLAFALDSKQNHLQTGVGRGEVGTLARLRSLSAG
jgi:hypothetical protein